ncbi:hypothetical protein F5Y09DRAFT_317545 [Xylaria sp. FL1042]|nr:hypothetical protein F5Y09DRAFT_317545 [Xylaria sp. FL1042]
MEELDNIYLCYHSRCSLCRFELIAGENIVAVYKSQTSKAFCFGQRRTWDESTSITFIHCQGQCAHPDGKAFVCHTECKAFMANNPSKALLDALTYTFEPLAAVEQRRRQWIQSHIRSSFMSFLKLGPHRLPPELALMVAQYCIRIYAIAAVCLPITQPSIYSIDILVGIWASYVVIDGVQYLASFANQPSDNAQLILSTKAAANVDRMYIAEDHLGIRQVYFGNGDPPRSAFNLLEVWWKTLSLRSSTQLRVYTDSFKIRRFECTISDETFYPTKNVSWLMPEPRPNLFRFHAFTSESQCQLRMSPLTCNNLQTTAYSAYWNSPIFYIQAHSPGEAQGSAIYSDIVARKKKGVWLYMPVDEGEYISQIWKRSRRLTLDLALLMVTNKGRVMMMGPQPKPKPSSYLGPWKWTLLHTSNGNPSRIFFDVTPYGIHKLAFESPEPIQQDQSPVIPIPLSPYPKLGSLDSYFYTFATLENVAEITPCEDKVAGKRSIIGLLFHYSDGTRACVGQFRLDCATTNLVIGTCPKLWLSFDTNDARPYVNGIGVCPAPKPKSHDCLYISWHGKLEWWFTDNQCKLYYKDQSSMQTRM